MRKKRDWQPDPAYVKERFHYDPDTGKLMWKFYTGQTYGWNARWSGKEAFTYLGKNGYRQGSLDNVNFHAHRIAWAIHYGEWPDGVIDHVNGDGADNRIANLRVVDVAGNARNSRRNKTNTSGVTGVVYFAKRGKWQAQIGVDGKCKFLGYFDTKEEAIAARKQAEIEYGFHQNHGRESGYGA